MLRRKEDGSVYNSYCQVRKLDVEAERIVSFFFSLNIGASFFLDSNSVWSRVSGNIGRPSSNSAPCFLFKAMPIRKIKHGGAVKGNEFSFYIRISMYWNQVLNASKTLWVDATHILSLWKGWYQITAQLTCCCFSRQVSLAVLELCRSVWPEPSLPRLKC